MSYNEADEGIRVCILILVFTVGVVVRLFNEIEIEDEAARINYVSTFSWTSSSNTGTPSSSTTTTL